MATYDASSFSLVHELTTTLDEITTGLVYSFSTRAANLKGSSPYSLVLQAAIASPPARPAAPTVDRAHSGASSLYIRWGPSLVDPTTSPGGDIAGYMLLMATPESGEDFVTVLDTVSSSTQVTEHLVVAPEHALVAGSNYRFKVVAVNFNGASLASEISTFRVCGSPSGMAKPFKVGSTTAPIPSITIGWQEPTSSGGCPILGYVVYVDDGAGGAFVEANVDLDPLVRG